MVEDPKQSLDTLTAFPSATSNAQPANQNLSQNNISPNDYAKQYRKQDLSLPLDSSMTGWVIGFIAHKLRGKEF